MVKEKIGMIGVIANPSTRLSSHNAGWTNIYKSMLIDKYDTEIDILNEKDDWSSYDILWVNEGVNFKAGVWNLFGGISDILKTRLAKLSTFKGEVNVWGHEVPNYKELCKTRKILIEDFPEIKWHRFIEKYKSIVLGDSHSMSTWIPGMNISRNDGKTLHGLLDDGIKEYIPDHISDTVMFYAGNIDIRHHLCRLYTPDKYAREIKKLITNLEYQLKSTGLNVIVVQPLPIENESRKLPKTGYYKGQPFWGPWVDRNKARSILSYQLEEMSINNGWEFVKWPDKFYNDMNELPFDVLEARQSVHVAPKHYLHANF
jgi:hypothetical protein